MKITDVQLRCYRIPLKETVRSAIFVLTHRELATVRVETDAGITGIGWLSTPAVGAGPACRLAREHMLPLLIGEDPRNHERIWSRLWQSCHYAGPGGITTLAMSGIDIALWDIKAKCANEPLHRLLGASREEVAVYASNIDLHLEKDALLSQIEEQLLAGYHTFKIKLGRATEEDLDRCRAVRALIGPNRELMLDANQKWRAAEAVQRCEMLARMQPLFIEEPLLSDDIRGHAHLCRQSRIPVALGEQLCNKYEFWNYVREGAADVLQPCVWKVGGITEWLKIAAIAECANLTISPHGALELSLHLAAAIPHSGAIENISGMSLFDLGATSTPLEIVNGIARPGDTPGHGVVFDETGLDSFETSA